MGDRREADQVLRPTKGTGCHSGSADGAFRNPGLVWQGWKSWIPVPVKAANTISHPLVKPVAWLA